MRLRLRTSIGDAECLLMGFGFDTTQTAESVDTILYQMKTALRLLPLLLIILLLFLSFILHFSFNTFTSTTTFSSSRSHFTPLQNPNFTLTIKVLAFDRIYSLSRCLRSLAKADYGSDRVNLHIFIDHFKKINVSRKGYQLLDKKLEESHRMLDFLDGFSWRFGDKFVHYRTKNVGLPSQWLEAWWPSSDDEFAFVVEDDLEVSPLFYKLLRRLIANYYYNCSNFSPSIYGASLQRPLFVPGEHGNKLQVDSETRLFLYQLVGTWGQLLFPKPWKEFRLWYDIHKEKEIKPVLQGMVTTRWLNGVGERVWTPWFIKFIHSRGYFNIYTNFLHERALSVSHRDAGVNYGKTAGPDSQLLDKASLDFKLLEMQPLSNLKWYDFCFREVLPGRIVRSFDELGPVLNTVQKHQTVIFVNLFRASQIVVKNMLCYFDKLDIRNYIFVGPMSDFFLDLARRGHPVIVAERLLNSVRGYKLKGFHGPKAELIKEIIVEAYLIKKCLDSRYNSWVMDGNMLPITSDMFSDVNGSASDIFATKDSELLFVRSSPAIAKIWGNDFVYKVATMANSLMSSSLSKEQQNFRHIVAKSLEEIGASIRRLDQLSLGLNLGSDHANQTSLGERTVVLWPMEMSLDSIQKKLSDLGMWVLDGDTSCTAVVCHQS